MTRRKKPKSPPAPPTDPPRNAPRYTADDQAAYRQAYAGVSPLAGEPRVVRRDGPHRVVRVRGRDVADPVMPSPRFHVTRDDGWFEAYREGCPGALRVLRRSPPEAEVDLHGCRVDEAQRRATDFVCRAHQTGKRVIRVIHGKGLHSPSGVGVLGEAVLSELTEGAAASLVLAIVTCSPRDGGSGAMLVHLGQS